MTVTDKDFKEKVVDGKGVILVDFWADWCYPCHMVAPVLEELGSELKDKGVVIAKFNVDENPVVANQLGIMSLPTMLIFKDGAVKGQVVGAQPKDVIKQALERAASS